MRSGEVRSKQRNMAEQSGGVTVTLTVEDIEHLMAKGATKVTADPDSPVTVSVRCEDHIEFEAAVKPDRKG